METYNSFSTTQLIIAGSLDSPHLNLGATATFVMLVIARTAKARCALWPARWTCVALLPEDLEMQLVVRRMLESRGNAFLERTHWNIVKAGCYRVVISNSAEKNAKLHDKANIWERLTGISLDLARLPLSLHHLYWLLLENHEFRVLDRGKVLTAVVKKEEEEGKRIDFGPFLSLVCNAGRQGVPSFGGFNVRGGLRAVAESGGGGER